MAHGRARDRTQPSEGERRKSQASHQPLNPGDRNGSPNLPEGWVGLEEAARMCGMSSKTWYVWELAGRVPPATWIPRPGGGRAKVYPADQVDRLRQTIGADAFPPAGFIQRDQAARLCGLDHEAFRYLEKQGRFPGARLVKKPGNRARVNVFPRMKCAGWPRNCDAPLRRPFRRRDL